MLFISIDVGWLMRVLPLDELEEIMRTRYLTLNLILSYALSRNPSEKVLSTASRTFQTGLW